MVKNCGTVIDVETKSVFYWYRKNLSILKLSAELIFPYAYWSYAQCLLCFCLPLSVYLYIGPGERARHMAAYANNHTIDSGCSSAIPSDAASDILAVFDSFLPPTMAHLADYVAPPVMHTLCRPTRRSFDGPRALFVCSFVVCWCTCLYSLIKRQLPAAVNFCCVPRADNWIGSCKRFSYRIGNCDLLQQLLSLLSFKCDFFYRFLCGAFIQKYCSFVE